MKRVTDPQVLEQAHRDYMQSRILTAHPTEIVEMLYQVAIDNLKEAIEQLKAGDRFARSRAVTKAQSAVHELTVSLDHSVNAPFTRTLADLYQYVLTPITMGHSRQSEREFRDALSILTTLGAAWTEVRKQVCEQNQSMAEAEPEQAAGAAPSASPYAQPVSAVGSRDWSC
jgi:flagellar biosynthetic protein FliS